MGKLLATSLMALALLVAPLTTAGEGGIALEEERLFFLFSPEVAEQRQRAIWLRGRFETLGAGGQFVAITRGASPMLEGVDADGAKSADIPPYLKSRLDADGDFFAVMGRGGQVHSVGRGGDLQRDFLRGVATEVDESTWGKVKELFK
jgi:hypothetical protein